MKTGLTTFITNSNKKGRHDTMEGLAYYAQKSMENKPIQRNLCYQCSQQNKLPEDNRHYPFCSESCHLAWADLHYKKRNSLGNELLTISEMQSRFKDMGNPVIVATKKRIDFLENKIASMRREYTQATPAMRRLLEQEAHPLKKELQRLYGKLSGTSSNGQLLIDKAV